MEMCGWNIILSFEGIVMLFCARRNTIRIPLPTDLPPFYFHVRREKKNTKRKLWKMENFI